MPTRPSTQSLSLSITNPLVLYRALLATKKIKPDPAQHRLALHLQKLYFRLKDYAPEVEYRYRLDKITRDLARHSRPRRHAAETARAEEQKEKQKQSQSRAVLSSLLSIKPSAFLTADTLALTRTTPLHDSALSIPSPKGMLLYGEVGRGKSMLLDMLYDSLPSRKKRRWHFNTFMLDLFRRIELARLDGLDGLRNNPRRSLFGGAHAGDHVVLSLAKDTIAESPILFLDEFQMPDRVAAKLINGFFTAFFHLGGVLVASSNRMPEELSKAAGVEFGGMHGNGNRWGKGAGGARGGFFGLGWGLSRESEGERAAKTDFGLFLDVLRARCEVWEMEGERDWRREGDDAVQVMDGREGEGEKEPGSEQDDAALEEDTWSLTTATTLASSTTPASPSSPLSSDSPAHYHVSTPGSSDDLSSFEDDVRALNPSATWHPANLTVYARQLVMRTTHKRILKASFHDLCAVYLGPADYVSLCSTFHTLILTDVPVLTAAHKNEARRFITLLDALYEARCRLVIHADAPPDKLFFPDTRARSAATLSTADGMLLGDNETFLNDDDDSITSEAFSEIYQDSTAPFRPNITTYTEGNTRSSTPRSFPPSLANPSVRTVLADEDADFGPTYGNGRGHGISISDSGVRVPEAHGMAGTSPDFTSTSALTGEDERFAYKRARSRLWEMCGRRWWDERLSRRHRAAQSKDEDQGGAEASEGEAEAEGEMPEWWRPIRREGRFWEKPARAQDDVDPLLSPSDWHLDLESASPRDHGQGHGQGHGNADIDPTSRRDGGSLFRTRADDNPPPKFGWQHAWGMMRWGKKAGEWGKGVEGKDRDRDRDRGREREPSGRVADRDDTPAPPARG